MVVDDFNFFRSRVTPSEDETPLVVDPDRMKASQVAAKGFQTIAGRYSEIAERSGSIDGGSGVTMPRGVSRVRLRRTGGPSTSVGPKERPSPEIRKVALVIGDDEGT